ncbi:hypothetical protein GMA11_06350 [Granulicatella sp. zg-ZJ]|nr:MULTISPECIES: hypothetical protein [unclassified Granulicatella]NEW63013.1 hypothetical protein [Granulicatella sp. zg-ZJ]NEW66232.1 hypothetical protein [Granulicatella sp. zg-84]QMI85927.1 hypothetical protein H1220_00710 [Carnobacteriaceae bacterium zg-84]
MKNKMLKKEEKEISDKNLEKILFYDTIMYVLALLFKECQKNQGGLSC